MALGFVRLTVETRSENVIQTDILILSRHSTVIYSHYFDKLLVSGVITDHYTKKLQ